MGAGHHQVGAPLRRVVRHRFAEAQGADADRRLLLDAGRSGHLRGFPQQLIAACLRFLDQGPAVLVVTQESEVADGMKQPQ